MSSSDTKMEYNQAFYDAVGARGLEKLAEEAGLKPSSDTKELPDVKATMSALKCLPISPLNQLQPNILIVGGGKYGRETKAFSKQFPQAAITIIEIKASFAKALKQHFLEHTVKQADIVTVPLQNNHWHLIVMFWCVLNDIPKAKQRPLLRKLARSLRVNGVLIIDQATHTPGSSNVAKTTDHSEEGHQGSLIRDDVKWQGYFPSQKRIQDFAKNAKLNCSLFNYKTHNGRPRVLYVLQKPMTAKL